MKERIVIVFLIFCIFSLCSCATTGIHSRERQYNKARTLLADEEFNKTIEYLSPKIEDQEDWRYYFYRGFAYYYQNDYVHALADFNRAITLEDQYPLLFVNRGNVYFKSGLPRKALEDYQQGLTHFDVADREKVLNGLVFQKKDIEGDFLEQTITNESIEGKRGKAILLYNMGFVYEDMKDMKDAFKHYTLSLETDNTYVPAYYRRGIAYLKKKQLTKALDDFNEAIRLAPQHASLYCIRGETYRGLKQYDRALTDFDRALSRNTQFARAYYCRSLTLKALDRGQEAKSDFLQALELGFKPSKSKIII